MGRFLGMALILFLFLTAPLRANRADRHAFVDPHGVLRWQEDSSEVALLGVNTYPPFSIDFQAIQSLGISHEEVIRQDVIHFQRLGLTAIRLHCFDREISDREGNLIDNDHLQLLDFLIQECKNRGIYTVLTPIAWWPPEAGGFSDLYTMPQMITNPEARKAQQTYLSQFVCHVNRYTGLAYKDDPAVVVFELINEPQYPPHLPDQDITQYINALVEAIRSTGCRKPIFYHAWLGQRFAACADSDVEGVTFGWYPTGLASGAAIHSDSLPLVQDYPLMRDPLLANKAKIVYEFDAADVHEGFMYPAMARSFRAGGVQIATQFQYDALPLAGTNVNWQTHCLNLITTPGKAISLAIAAEVFRRTPRLEPPVVYPDNDRFGPFRVSYEGRLSELVTEETFLYSNDTTTLPPKPENLTRVAGCGSSPLVLYTGTGAYFLDRVSPGLWHLQVYPDVVVIKDPYSGGGDEKIRILHEKRSMILRLPDLLPKYQCVQLPDHAVSEDALYTRSRGPTLLPGDYLLAADGRTIPDKTFDIPFIVPPAMNGPLAVRVPLPRTWREGVGLSLDATVASENVLGCDLFFQTKDMNRPKRISSDHRIPYQYRFDIPARLMTPGEASCFLRIQGTAGPLRFPGGLPFLKRDESPLEPLDLFRLSERTILPELRYDGERVAKALLVEGSGMGKSCLRMDVRGFVPQPSVASMEWKALNKPQDPSRYGAICVKARGGPDTPGVEISLVDSDGRAIGAVIPIQPLWQEITLPLSDLKPMWWGTGGQGADLSKLDHLTLVFGSWILGSLSDRLHRVEIESIRLIESPREWSLQVRPSASPVILAEPGLILPKIEGRPAACSVRAGMDPGRTSFRVAVDQFREAPDCTSFRMHVPDHTEIWSDRTLQAQKLVIKARSGEPGTDLLEIVLIEKDTSPWGTMQVPLTQEWQAIELPLQDFRFFSHWWHEARDRGADGDVLHPENIEWINLCFGAWLYPGREGQPHAIEVQDIALE